MSLGSPSEEALGDFRECPCSFPQPQLIILTDKGDGK